MKSEYSISVITPIYNEGTATVDFVNTIGRYLKSITDDFEVILIESGSNDGSKEICDRLNEEHEFVKVIHEKDRNGFGSALKLGYQNAVCDLVWLVTVDIPFTLESLELALPLLAEKRAVLSYRSKDPRKIMRKIQSFVYNKTINILLRLKVKHINSAFKLYRREDIKRMELLSNGWFIDAEMIYWMKYLDISFAQIPVPLIDREIGVSTISSSTFVKVLKEMFIFIKHIRCIKQN